MKSVSGGLLGGGQDEQALNNGVFFDNAIRRYFLLNSDTEIGESTSLRGYRYHSDKRVLCTQHIYFHQFLSK